MTEFEINELGEYLAGFLTSRRKKRIEEVLARRSRSLVAVVEDIYDPHNANAVIRSCDAFGVQELHIIENRNAFSTSNRVSSGSRRWVDLHRYTSPSLNDLSTEKTVECIEALKARGYSILATTPHGNTIPLPQLEVTGPVAVMFGSEHLGLSQIALSMADHRVVIPMDGFCESLNLSVSAALSLYAIKEKLQNGELWTHLSESEKSLLRLSWARASLKRADKLEKEFFNHRR